MVAFFVFVIVFIVSAVQTSSPQQTEQEATQRDVLSENTLLASDALETLPIKGRAPKTGYSRSEFSSGWAQIDGCDVRNRVLADQLSEIEVDEDGCSVLVGILNDPYSGNQQVFVRGQDTSSDVQIDHVVALSDAWQKGARVLSAEQRLEFANDTLNLLAVNGDLNQQKGDSDAASWLPPNKSFRCQYVARQIAVKDKYGLWVSEAEYAAMKRELNNCPTQVLPYAQY